MKKRKICVITGTRAEYGLLSRFMRYINEDQKLELQIIATGMHLSPEFGFTYKEIDKDGFTISRKVEMLLSADTPSGISKSIGLGLIGFSDAFNDLNPDIIVILGDRFEILSATIAAFCAKIPIAHIHGGETTEGVFDEGIRHSITKMSWWHFVAADEYKNRVLQLGENPKRVFNVGGLGVDAIKKTKLLSKNELMKKTKINFGSKNLLITYHPVTLEKQTSHRYIKSLLKVLDDLNDIYLIFTMPNSDPEGRIIKEEIEKFVSNNQHRSISFNSMGHLNYWSALQFVDGVIGNSSSGLAEAPTFKIGTINIGDRQKGRIKAQSVIDCKPTKTSIEKAINILYSNEFQSTLSTINNPYNSNKAAEKIWKTLSDILLPKVMKKQFYNI